MAENNKPDRPYEIGRGKPPKSGQFKKGQSGFPQGRPKGSKNRATVFLNESSRRVTVTEDGIRKKISKYQAAIKQLVNKAASGDHKAMQLYLKEFGDYEASSANPAEKELALMANDEQVIANFIKRIRETTPFESSAEAGTDQLPTNTSETDKGGTL